MTSSKNSINKNLNFLGIDLIDNITDSTATINWTHVTDASVYHIYQVTESDLIFINAILAPTNKFELTGLNPNQKYTYFIRAFDSKGQQDSNTKNVTITTNNAPTAPTSLSLSNPVVSPGFEDTPKILVGGVKKGDTINLYTDENCSVQIGTAASSGSTVEITTSSLTPTTYTFYAQAIGENASDCSTANVNYERRNCPIGYVPVPANPVVGVNNNFCVMKYEAKAWSDDNSNTIVDSGEVDADGCGEPSCSTSNWAVIPIYKPASVETGLPWRHISQAQAIQACDALNDVGETNFALISNPEWMAIARNIEAQDVNWTGGTVGIGQLFQGNNGYNTPSSYNIGGIPDGGTGRNPKAMHVLSNGEEVWDISGNVWNWVDWNVIPANKAYYSVDGNPVGNYRELNLLDTLIGPTDEMNPETWQPSNASYDSNQGVGQYHAGPNSSGGAAFRGGRYDDGIYTGIYALFIKRDSSTSGVDIGFRCVYRP